MKRIATAKGTSVTDEPSRHLQAALIETSNTTADDWTEGMLAELALRLSRVSALARKLAELQMWLEIELVDRMETDTVPVPGLGTLHRSPSNNSTWKHGGAGEELRTDLARAVADEIALDVATGELDPIKRNIALATLRAAYEAIPAFSSLKAAGPKRFGVHISEYRDYSTSYRVTLDVEVPR